MANTDEIHASNINSSCLYRVILSPILSNISTQIKATIKKVIKRLSITQILLLGSSSMLSLFTGFSAKKIFLIFVITTPNFYI
jgi:hypothetical protein